MPATQEFVEELREATRQAHEAAQHLRDATREAREFYEGELRAKVVEEIRSHTVVELGRQGEEIRAAMRRASEKVISEFDRLFLLLIGGENADRDEPLDKLLKEKVVDRLDEHDARIEYLEGRRRRQRARA